MKNCNRIFCALALSLVTVVSFVSNARATLTYTNEHLEMMVCFRQVGTANPFDLEVNIGSVTNLIALSPGTTITNTNFTSLQLSNAMASAAFDNSEFSVTASSYNGNITSFAVPANTVWATIPRGDPATQNDPWTRRINTTTRNAALQEYNIGLRAASYAGTIATDPLVNTNSEVGIPPANPNSCETFLGSAGNLHSTYFAVENVASAPFGSPIISDFFMEVPKNFADPLNGNATSGTSDYLGYFTFYPSGQLTFTRATATVSGPPPAPTLTITRTNNTSTISFGTTNGATYNLVFTNISGLGAPLTNWFTLGSPITGNGGNTNFNDTTTDSNRVYSVSAH